MSPFGYYLDVQNGEAGCESEPLRFGGLHPGAPDQARMDQISLAKRRTAGSGLSNGAGKPRAEIGLILRTLKSLEISIDVEADSPVETSSQVKLLVERRSQATMQSGDLILKEPAMSCLHKVKLSRERGS